jgi:ParB-like chromosome segregation protein Spo0J
VSETNVAPSVLEHVGAGTDGDQYQDSTALVVGVESIIVADRYRRDLGDVSDLAKSIVDVGLLNPITVREWHGGYRLVAGERRLTAFKQLGLAEIPVRVARDIADARDALVAERDENTARKPMLPSEATALGMAIEEMERPLNRPGFRSDLHGTSGSRDPEVRPRDIAAEAIGMSEPSYRRIKQVMKTATDENEPGEVRAAAMEALEKIDAGEPIRPHIERIRETRRKTETVTVETPATRTNDPQKSVRSNDPTDYLTNLAAKHPTARIAFATEAHTRYANVDSMINATQRAGIRWTYTEKQWQARVATSADVLDRSSLAVSIALDAIDVRVDMQTITPEQATEALERLNSSALNRIIRHLKEISNE